MHDGAQRHIKLQPRNFLDEKKFKNTSMGKQCRYEQNRESLDPCKNNNERNATLQTRMV